MANSFNRIPSAVYDLVNANYAVYKPIIDTTRAASKAGGLLDLCNFLTAQDNGVGAATRLVDLNFVNVELQSNLLALPANVGSLVNLRAGWIFLAALQKPHILTFCSRRSAATRLRDLVVLTQPIPQLAPLPVVMTQSILNLIAAVVAAMTQHDPGYVGAFDGLARGALANLTQVLALHAPNSGFAGFARWGEGNHSSPQSNGKWHFLKHVLFMDDGGGLDRGGAEILISAASGVGATSEDTHAVMESLLEADQEDDAATTDECADWWATLRIQLPKAQCDTLITNRQDKDKMQHWFTTHGGQEVLSHGYIGAFLDEGILGRAPQLIAWFMQNYQTRYEQYAIGHSVNMQEVLVKCDGVKVFVVGTDGDNFIIGRIGSDGTLGISSCYRPRDIHEKMRGSRTTMMWSLV